MRSHPWLVLLLGLMLSCCSTPARRWTPFEPPRPEKHGSFEFLLRYDSNGDGKITRAELEAGLRQDFRQADTNHDGLLDPDEVLAVNQRHIRIDQSIAIPIIDWNQDGCIDFHEYSGTALSLFDSLDTDGDGQLTAKEINPAAKNPGPKQGAPGGRHGRGRGGGGEPDGGGGDGSEGQ